MDFGCLPDLIVFTFPPLLLRALLDRQKLDLSLDAVIGAQYPQLHQLLIEIPSEWEVQIFRKQREEVESSK